MNFREIPCRTDSPRYTLRTELDSARFEFFFEWNDREQAWFFTLYDASGDAIVYSVRVECTAPLLDQFYDTRLPPGMLFAVDTSGGDLAPALEDLGARVQLVYLPISEMSEELRTARAAMRG